jgi:hypothetical protein
MTTRRKKRSPQRARRMSDPEQLIADIAAELRADTKDIRFRLQATRSLYCFYTERLPPGKQKRIALALSRALKNARSLSQQIEPLFGRMLDESDYRSRFTRPRRILSTIDAPSRGWVSYEQSLTQGIKIADELAATIIVTRGKTPPNVGKFFAKRLATELLPTYQPSDQGPVRTPDEDVNHIATLIYEFITGSRDADIPSL